jgi:predicted HTH transcriptional regulator
MSIYNKPLSQIRTEDLNELLTEGAVESVRLEFKQEVPGKDETLKKLSSFANTFGGYMVVGAKASSADGRIEDLPGVDVQAGYKQKIVQWCFEAVSPPLNAKYLIRSKCLPEPEKSATSCTSPRAILPRTF